MGKNVLAAFRPVKFEYGKVHMSGGFTAKKSAMKSKTVEDAAGIEKHFVKMAASEPWLVLPTTGSANKNVSSIERTSLLGDLRDRIAQLCDGGQSTEANPPPAEYDPMMELEMGTGSSTDVIAAGKPAGRSAKLQRWRYTQNAAKHCITSIDMPYECPEVGPNTTKITTVSVYVEDRKTIWLSIDDVEWALTYLFTQNQLKGVPLVDDDDAGPGAPPQQKHILGTGGTADAGNADPVVTGSP